MLVIANIIALILETVPSIHDAYPTVFKDFDLISVAIFTIEYILRLWSITSEEKYKRPIVGRIRYMLTPVALIDLVAIIPFYLPFVMAMDLRFLRAFRLLRLAKLGRYSSAMQTLLKVARSRKEELIGCMSLTFLLIILFPG